MTEEKTLTTDSMVEIPVEAPVRPEDKIPLREKLAYGAMDIFGGGQGSLLSLLLMYFFTSVVGVNPGFAGTAVLIAKIWDAIIDPTFGIITDNTRTKLGRRRPYIIAGGALIIPAMLFLFAPIQGFGEVAKSVWVCVAYLVYCSVSSLSQVPFNSMSSDISPDYRERNKATIIHSLNVDFEQLSQENKQKVLAQFKVGLIAVQEMAEAATKTAEEDKNKGKE
jgi:Na+/melibiose symporter-like transporter